MDKSIGIGLIGCGTVGSGVAHILLHGNPPIGSRCGLNVRLAGIADIDSKRPRKVLTTGEVINIPSALFERGAEELIDAPDVHVVVELIGGEEPACSYILRALKAGKSVVTANKLLLAQHGREIFTTAASHGASVGFEASVGGGIPCLLALREGLVANRIDRIGGILNGTTNYILTEMTMHHRTYADALSDAQARGYAEVPPTLDVGGFDAANKLVILASLAFGQLFKKSDVVIEGIEKLTPDDFETADALGYALKLVAQAHRTGDVVELRVHPTLIPKDSLLAGVHGTFNAVTLCGDAVGEQLFYGHGAGQMPTASAVVSDIVDAARGTARLSFAQQRFYRDTGQPLRVKPPSELCARCVIRLELLDAQGSMQKAGEYFARSGLALADVPRILQVSGGTRCLWVTRSLREDSLTTALRAIREIVPLRSEPSFLRISD